MAQTAHIIEDIKAPIVTPPKDGTRKEGGVTVFDLEALCPVELIRVHTKTDDVPYVTDDQIRMYRKVAFEQAMMYSALLCGPVQQVIEILKYKRPTPRFSHTTMHQHIMHETTYPVHAPYVYVYGGVARENKPIFVEEGERRIKVVTHSPDMYFDNCCDPCSSSGMTSQQIMYYSGYECPEEVPSGIALGMLKFIAWSIMRPGDELLTQRNRTSIAEAGVTGTNNAAWASGALELWVAYDRLRY